MSIASAFQMVGDQLPQEFDEPTTSSYELKPLTIDDVHAQFSTAIAPAPNYFNGYISPCPANNWNIHAPIFSQFEDDEKFPVVNDRIDPNKIFSSDIQALKALASDQLKITRMFEKHLKESLSEKGKIGVTEDDIMAMQAVTSARAAVTSIQKEISSIKKSTAELRIKQQTNAQKLAVGNAGTPGDQSGNMNGGGDDMGHSILDNIFKAAVVPASSYVPAPPANIQDIDTAKATEILENIAPSVGDNITYEPLNPTTYVLLGETDDDVEYATFAADGTLIPDYNNPTIEIKSIDRDAMTARDELYNQYPIKLKSEME